MAGSKVRNEDDAGRRGGRIPPPSQAGDRPRRTPTSSPRNEFRSIQPAPDADRGRRRRSEVLRIRNNHASLHLLPARPSSTPLPPPAPSPGLGAPPPGNQRVPLAHARDPASPPALPALPAGGAGGDGSRTPARHVLPHEGRGTPEADKNVPLRAKRCIRATLRGRRPGEPVRGWHAGFVDTQSQTCNRMSGRAGADQRERSLDGAPVSRVFAESPAGRTSGGAHSVRVGM